MIREIPLRSLSAGAIVAAVAVAGITAPTYAQERPLLVERATVLPARGVAVFGGVASEFGREGISDQSPASDGAEYDNLRIGPLGVRLGLGDDVEVGGYFTANANDEDDDGAPDESGLEGLTAYGKLAATDHVALTAGVTVAGSDDVGPYPNDGLDFFVNAPMQRRLGVGLLYGELGFTVQDDDIGGSFVNYGIGYAVPMDDQLSLNAELVGEESGNADRFRDGNTMSLVLGANLRPERNMEISPYLSLGLYDAAPSAAMGASFELRM